MLCYQLLEKRYKKAFQIYARGTIAIRFELFVGIVAMANWMHFNDDGGCTIIIWIWFMHCINECKTSWMKWQCTVLWLLFVKCYFYLICPHIIQVQHSSAQHSGAQHIFASVYRWLKICIIFEMWSTSPVHVMQLHSARVDFVAEIGICVCLCKFIRKTPN